MNDEYQQVLAESENRNRIYREQDRSAERPYFFREFTSSDPKYNAPIPTAKLPLKQHQKVLLKQCIRLENVGIDITDDEELNGVYKHVKSNMGVIADKTGSGKSYTVLAMLLANDIPLIKYSTTFVYAQGHMAFKVKRDNLLQLLNVNVIVMPHSLVKQWLGYIQSFSDSFVTYVINSHRSLHGLDAALGDQQDTAQQDDNDVGINRKPNLILVTANFYRHLHVYLTNKSYKVKRVIFDEADTACTPSAKRIPAYFYWFVTASFRNILNPHPSWHLNDRDWSQSYLISAGVFNNAFVKNIFATLLRTMHTLDRRCIDKIVLRNEDAFVDASFALEDAANHIIICRSPIEVTVLEGVLNRNMLAALNAGDTRGALAMLHPSNIASDDSNIIELVRKDMEIQLNNVIVRQSLENNMIFQNENLRRNRLRKIDDDRKSLEHRMQLIASRIKSADACPICFGELDTKTVTKCCQNAFCLKCISRWLNEQNTCPVCKAPLTTNMLMIRTEDAQKIKIKTKSDTSEIRSKAEVLRDLFVNTFIPSKKFKVMVCTEYDNSFDSISKTLTDLGLTFGTLKGNCILKTVREYTTGDLNIVMVNARAYGSGLNLQNTTDIVMMHKMADQTEQQVIGRAQRPGRAGRLNVWKLLHHNECDV